MADLDRLIVQKLLAKYENSAHYRTVTSGAPARNGTGAASGDGTLNASASAGAAARSGRRVLLQLGPRSRDLKAYDIENVEQKEAVHASIARLKAAGLVDFAWERFNAGNVMAQVWLNLDRIDDTYAFIGLAPRRDAVDAMLADIQALIDRLDGLPGQQDDGSVHVGADNRLWVLPALRGMASRIAESHKWTPALPEDPDLARNLFSVLGALAQPDFTPTPVRVFSIQCFRDSKHLERALLPRLVSLVRKYHALYKEPEADKTPELTGEDETGAPDDLLALIGLSRNPEIFEFCGAVRLTFMAPDSPDHHPGDPIGKAPVTFDYAALPQGACLSSSSIDRIVAVEAPQIRRLLFIENRTNYEAYIRSRPYPASQELVMYHGGFHGPVKLQFFRRLVAALPPDAAIFHWGDIDLGGIRIFLQISNDIAPNLQPWRMDAQTLLENKARALPFSQPYRAALEKAFMDPAFGTFRELIAAMLDLGLRLEQEALI